LDLSGVFFITDIVVVGCGWLILLQWW